MHNGTLNIYSPNLRIVILIIFTKHGGHVLRLSYLFSKLPFEFEETASRSSSSAVISRQ